MYCKTCGKEIIGQGVFCQSCGVKLEAPEASQPAVQTPQSAFGGVAPVTQTVTAAPKKAKKALVPILAGVLAVALVVTGVFTHGFGLFGEKKPSNPLAITRDAINSYFDLSSVHVEQRLIRGTDWSMEKFSGDFYFGDSFDKLTVLETGEGESEYPASGSDPGGIYPWSYSSALFKGQYASKDSNYDWNEKQNKISYQYNTDVLTEWFSSYLFPTLFEHEMGNTTAYINADWDSVLTNGKYDIDKALKATIKRYAEYSDEYKGTDIEYQEAAVGQFIDWFTTFIDVECELSSIQDKYVSNYTKAKNGKLTTYEYELDTERFLDDLIDYIAASLPNGRTGHEYKSTELIRLFEDLAENETVDGFVAQMKASFKEKLSECDPMKIKLTVDGKGVMQDIQFSIERDGNTVYFNSLKLSEHNSVTIDTNEVNALIAAAKQNADNQ
jgi:hypothetical protein